MKDWGAIELIEVPAQHRFDEAALARHLDRALPGPSGRLRIRQFQGGQSNPTFLVERGAERLVLRKQPPGQLLPNAHRIDREFRIMRALGPAGFPVPRMVHYCEDGSIVGTPFFLMEHVEGRILADPALPELPRGERRAAWKELVATLARLHALDWRGLGLEDYGRPDGYAARQVKTWTGQYAASKTSDIPEMDALGAWLAAHIPAEERPGIAHGDFRFGNMILACYRPRIIAVLDWELSTIGHATADLAYCLMPFRLNRDARAGPGVLGRDLSAEGLPGEAELIADYAAAAGLARLSHWAFFMALSIFRLAAIVQGVYARALQGNASSSSGLAMGARVPELARAGLAVIGHT
jgi:aminoglycoside phosphotransferase (APT) family kinase protein